jgi:CCR4-NOT transcription complex subunit 4
MITNAVPAEPSKKKGKESVKSQRSTQPSKSSTPQPTAPRERRGLPDLEHVLKAITSPDFKFVFSTASLTPEELDVITNFPQLLDPNGGAKRRAMKDKQSQAAEDTAPAIAPNLEPEDNPEGGSLQLGGEPEERHETGRGHHLAIAPPGQANAGLGFGQGLTDDFSGLGLNGRSLTVQQQQQLLLLKSTTPQSAALLSNFQQQQGPGQPGSAPGHARHTSRFSFANDSASASAAVQPVANAKLMNQQSSMMPKNTNHFNQLSQQQGLGNQFYTSGIQGPPPGLKATGTLPVSGGGMFAQGHGFATGGVGYGANVAGRANDPYQDLLRDRGAGARMSDAGKRESMFPSFLHQHPTTSTPAPAPGLLSFPYGASPGAYQDSGPQKTKKKGKKHRHANTSSSGGGGVVDVADPSILQARLHQGGVMGGQGIYGGQGQGGFTSMYTNNNFGAGGRW